MLTNCPRSGRQVAGGQASFSRGDTNEDASSVRHAIGLGDIGVAVRSIGAANATPRDSSNPTTAQFGFRIWPTKIFSHASLPTLTTPSLLLAPMTVDPATKSSRGEGPARNSYLPLAPTRQHMVSTGWPKREGNAASTYWASPSSLTMTPTLSGPPSASSSDQSGPRCTSIPSCKLSMVTTSPGLGVCAAARFGSSNGDSRSVRKASCN
mmetsp:Transcript_36135/g.77059  ORF Transcript_36135/g.77059 Transcript_36135/m.77059 type:complete len:209 (-) Transcript_36135:444-1070(-)